jgi:hypothetical protein
MAITTRSGKGSALTHGEMDTNLNQIPNGANSSITDNGTNVGIGETAPNSSLVIKNTSANDGIRIHSPTTGEGYLIFRDNDHASPGAVVYKHDTDALIFKGNGAEKLRILSSGGITFNGDTSTANALDDYEEGTWTPVCDGITPTTATGTYTKIGNICYIGIFINIGSQSSTASAIISGFPFTVKYDNNSTRAGLSCSYTTLGSMSTFLLSDNSSLGHIRKLTGSIYNWSEISSTVFHIGGTYQTT